MSSKVAVKSEEFAITADSLSFVAESNKRGYLKEVLQHLVRRAKDGCSYAVVRQEHLTPEVTESLLARGFIIGSPCIGGGREILWGAHRATETPKASGS